MRTRTEQVVPSASRLLNSLRDLGYDFVNAVADVVDNSVSAGATGVEIEIRSDGPDSWVRIADNGHGMAGATITEAMRLGTGQRSYGKEELGKFGLGLKTASLSQARSITVASRTSSTRANIDCRHMDLDNIQASDRWEIEIPTAATRPKAVADPLRAGPGTVVLWQKLDRVLDRTDPFGTWAQRHLLKLAERLDRHLGMVFGRFISGASKRKGRLRITVNGTRVEAWDPFCLQERTERLPEQEFRVAGSVVRYRPYVLPPQNDFSSDEAWRLASGPNQWNRQQGLYIYRADRMIQSGGWSWLRGTDEHIKLARASVEFWPDLDEAFEINVAKTRVKLPEDLRDQLKTQVGLLTKRADERYRKSTPRRPPSRPQQNSPGAGRGTTSTTGSTVQIQSNGKVNAPLKDGTSHLGRTAKDPSTSYHPADNDKGNGNTVRQATPAGQALEDAARRLGLGTAIQQIRQEICSSNPEVADELGW